MWEYFALLLVIFVINVFLYYISIKENAGIFSLVGALFGTFIDLTTFGQNIPAEPYTQIFFILIQWLLVLFIAMR